MILVVGGAGFIGSHMAKLLRKVGESHLIFDSLEKGHRAAIGDSRLVVGDLRDPKGLERVFAEFDIDLVMHFAAYIEVGESVADPAKYYWNNVHGVMVLLEQMRRAGVGRFVFSSTAGVYGEPETDLLREDHPTRPVSPYADSKLAVERMLSAFSQAYGLRAAVLRYFNAAGADPDGELGEDHRPETHLIPRALLAGMGKLPPLKLFGTDYPTADGTCIRDYIHVCDLAEAHLLAVRALREGAESFTCNLGTSHGFSVREVIETCSKVMGSPIPFDLAERRPGDPAKLVAAAGKARELLGWSARTPELEKIVADAWAWRREHPDGYAPVTD